MHKKEKEKKKINLLWRRNESLIREIFAWADEIILFRGKSFTVPNITAFNCEHEKETKLKSKIKKKMHVLASSFFTASDRNQERRKDCNREKGRSRSKKKKKNMNNPVRKSF